MLAYIVAEKAGDELFPPGTSAPLISLDFRGEPMYVAMLPRLSHVQFLVEVSILVACSSHGV